MSPSKHVGIAENLKVCDMFDVVVRMNVSENFTHFERKEAGRSRSQRVRDGGDLESKRIERVQMSLDS